MKRIPVKARIIFLLSCAFLTILYFTLISIPALEISSVKITVSSGNTSIPYGIEHVLSSLRGRPILGINIRNLEKKLSDLAVVQSLSLRRKLPSTLLVSLTVASPSAIVSSLDENDGQTGMFLVKEHKLLALDKEDWGLFGKGPIIVQVPQRYATMLQEYGTDETFLKVMELASSLDGDSSLITRIKYDNNSSNSFGKMVLEFSSINAQLWVREPVSTERIASAVALVVEDSENSLSFLSTGPLRYDLYKSAMVRRY